MRELLLLGIIAPCFLFAVRQPVFGILMFVWLGFFNPQSFTWGDTPLSMLMAVCTLLGYIFSSEPKKLPTQREAILLLLLWIVFGITTVFAIYPDRALRELTFVSKILLMVFLSMCLLNTEERLHWLIRVITLSLGFYAVKGVGFVFVRGGESTVLGPSGSFLHANNMIGLALAMNLPLLAYLIKREEQAWLRWICRAMFVCSYPTIMFTYSRGAWLGMAAASVWMALRSPYRFRLAAGAAFFALFLAPIVMTLVPERLVDRYEDLEHYKTESSAQMRFGSWAYCWRVAKDNPITGGGFEHYSVLNYEKYAPEYLDQWGGTARWRRTSCHSVWFSIIGEHGFLGASLWFGLLGSAFLSLLWVRSFAKAYSEISWMGDLAGALQVSFVAYAVVGTFIDAAYFDMLYYLVAIVVIMKGLLEAFWLTRASPEVENVPQRSVLLPVKNSFPG